MATEGEILEQLTALGAALSFKIPQSTESMWVQIFGSNRVDGEDLKRACVQYIAETKARRLPLPGELFELMAKARKRDEARQLDGYECRDCKQLGLVRKSRKHRGKTIEYYTPCICALGRAKLAYLESERKKGRAYRPSLER